MRIHWTHRVANHIHHKVPGSSVKVLEFSLLALLNTVTTFTLLLILAVILNQESLIFWITLSFVILRFLTGGIHFSSSW